MDFEVTQIFATDIQDAWFQCISKILDVGFRYEIQHGSYVGQTRLEFDQAIIFIKHPYSEPYTTPCSRRYRRPSAYRIRLANGYIEQYLPYLMTRPYRTRGAVYLWFQNVRPDPALDRGIERDAEEPIRPSCRSGVPKIIGSPIPPA